MLIRTAQTLKKLIIIIHLIAILRPLKHKYSIYEELEKRPQNSLRNGNGTVFPINN